MKAVTKAYEFVRAGIAQGLYRPDARITEQEIATQAGVSRTPVREALRRLQSEGLLKVVPNQGAVVTRWSDADAEDIFELRALLESYGVRRAARRASAEQLAALHAFARKQLDVARGSAEDRLEQISDLNRRFHQLLGDCAGSQRLKTTLATLIEAPLILQTLHDYSQDDLLRSAGHHVEIVQALEARDEEWAASVMRSHILAARRVFRSKCRKAARAGEEASAADPKCTQDGTVSGRHKT